MIVNLLALTFLLAAIVAGCVVIARALRRLPQDRNPACVRCGQSGAVLTSFVCPGCGNDVRDAGLVPSAGRRPASLLLRMVGWTAALLLLAVAATLLLTQVLPTHHKFQLTSTARFHRPQDGRYDEVELLAVGAGVVQGQTIRAQLEAAVVLPDGRARTLIVHCPSGRAEWVVPDSEQRAAMGQYSRDLLIEWLDRNGVKLDTTVPETAVELDMLDGSIRYVIEGGDLFSPAVGAQVNAGRMTSWGGSGSASWPDWVTPAGAIVWPAVWLGGVVFLTRRATRPRATAPPGVPA